MVTSSLTYRTSPLWRAKELFRDHIDSLRNTKREMTPEEAAEHDLAVPLILEAAAGPGKYRAAAAEIRANLLEIVDDNFIDDRRTTMALRRVDAENTEAMTAAAEIAQLLSGLVIETGRRLRLPKSLPVTVDLQHLRSLEKKRIESYPLPQRVLAELRNQVWNRCGAERLGRVETANLMSQATKVLAAVAAEHAVKDLDRLMVMLEMIAEYNALKLWDEYNNFADTNKSAAVLAIAIVIAAREQTGGQMWLPDWHRFDVSGPALREGSGEGWNEFFPPEAGEG